MKKLLILIILVGFSTTAMANVKIGYVDVQKALQATKAGKNAKKSLEKEFNKKKKELEAMEKDLKKMRDDLEKKSLALSDEMKAKKQTEIQREFIKFQQIMAKSQQEIQVKEREVTTPILEKLRKVIDKIASRDKYDMIFEKSQQNQNVIWAKSSLDLTDQVVKEFEKTK